jgi:hypothetical protein
VMIDLIRSEEEKHQEFLGKISKMFSEEIEGGSPQRTKDGPFRLPRLSNATIWPHFPNRSRVH